MTRTITGLFDTYDDAAKAVRCLEDAGIPYRDISIISNSKDKRHVVSMGTTDDASEGAGVGMAVGGAIGGGAGLLAGLGVIAIPGLGPMLAAGWLAATAAGAAAGAATGGIIGALTGAGISDEDAHVYAEGVCRGGTLVVTRVEDDQYATARSILESKAVDVAARAKTYRQSGWTPFGHTAGSTPSRNPLIESNRVTGNSVYDPNGKHLGTVRRLMIDRVSGRVDHVVMAFGGIHGMGEVTQVIPWDALTYDENLGGYRTRITEDQVRGGKTRLARDR
jgi:sporulation protein YlmC with PRC-barrel domain